MSELSQPAESILPGQAATASALTPLQRRMVLALLIGLLGFAATVDPEGESFADSERLNPVFLWTGCVLLGQPCLLAIWAALRRQPLAVRLPRALGLAACLGLVGLWAISGHPSSSIGNSVLAAPILIVLAMLPLLLFVRWRYGWEIVLQGEAASTASVKSRFSLRQLFLWITGTAVFLALARWTAAPGNVETDSWSAFASWGLLLGLLAPASAPLIVPCIGYCLSPNGQQRFAIWVHIVAVIALVLQSSTILIINGLPFDLSSLDMTWPVSLTIGVLATVLVGLGLLRLAGYRLTPGRPGTVSSAGTEPSAVATPGSRPRRWWRSPSPYLVGALGLLAVAWCWSAWNVQSARRQAYADWMAAEPFRRIGVQATFSGGLLEWIQFPENEPVSEAALQLLQQYSNQSILSELDFSGRGLTDEQLKYVSRMKTLCCLNLAGTQITDAGLAYLGSLPNLVFLDVGNTRITDQSLKALQRFPSLGFLRLRGTRVSDAGLVYLNCLKKLRFLDVCDTQLTDEAAKSLKRFYRLNGLFLTGTRITDAGLNQLRTLGGLDYLGVADTQVTASGKAQFARELPNCDTSLPRSDFLSPWVIP